MEEKGKRGENESLVGKVEDSLASREDVVILDIDEVIDESELTRGAIYKPGVLYGVNFAIIPLKEMFSDNSLNRWLTKGLPPAESKGRSKFYYYPGEIEDSHSREYGKKKVRGLSLGRILYREVVGSYSRRTIFEHNIQLTNSALAKKLEFEEPDKKIVEEVEGTLRAERCFDGNEILEDLIGIICVTPYLNKAHFESRYPNDRQEFQRMPNIRPANQRYASREHSNECVRLWEMNKLLAGKAKFGRWLKRNFEEKGYELILDEPKSALQDREESSFSHERESCKGPIGPGYYVGGRRFDMDGLPADD